MSSTKALLRIEDEDVAMDLSAVALVGEGAERALYVVSDETQTIDRLEKVGPSDCYTEVFEHRGGKKLADLLPHLPELGDGRNWTLMSAAV